MPTGEGAAEVTLVLPATCGSAWSRALCLARRVFAAKLLVDRFHAIAITTRGDDCERRASCAMFDLHSRGWTQANCERTHTLDSLGGLIIINRVLLALIVVLLSFARMLHLDRKWPFKWSTSREPAKRLREPCLP